MSSVQEPDGERAAPRAARGYARHWMPPYMKGKRRCSRRGGEPRVVRKIAARPAGRPRSVAGHRTGLRPGAVNAPQATGYARGLTAGLSGTGDHASETGEEWRGDGCIPLWKTVMEGRSILVPPDEFCGAIRGEMIS